MAFVLEDSTGIEDANALVSVAELTTYLTDRNDTTTYTDEQKQSAIISASVDYIDTFFTFKGKKLNDEQGMQIPTDCVPLNATVKRAALQASVLSLKGRLFVDPVSIESRAVTSTSSKVASLSKTVDYAENATYTTKYPTTSIDRLLSKYTVGNSSGLGSLVSA